MDNHKSDQKIKEFHQKPFQSRRETRTTGWKFRATPEGLFPLLCSVREADWLSGSNHDLIYSASGYAEKDYIFKSEYFGFGEEIWVRYEHIENESLGYVRFSKNIIVMFTIKLHNNCDGTVSTQWRSTYTALNEDGNTIISQLPPKWELDPIMEMLQQYLDIR